MCLIEKNEEEYFCVTYFMNSLTNFRIVEKKCVDIK